MPHRNSIPPESKIVFASFNRGKFEEMQNLLADAHIELLFGGDLGGPDVEETGKTYEENALLKARAWAARTGFPALADDSGLEVYALGLEPGIYSARVAPSPEERITWLLGRLDGVADRRARFVAVLALVFPDGRDVVVRGECPGRIADSPSGSAGFGYDPVFVPELEDRTFAEMGEAVKDGISHRACATRALLDVLFPPPVVKSEFA